MSLFEIKQRMVGYLHRHFKAEAREGCIEPVYNCTDFEGFTNPEGFKFQVGYLRKSKSTENYCVILCAWFKTPVHYSFYVASMSDLKEIENHSFLREFLRLSKEAGIEQPVVTEALRTIESGS